MGSLMDDAVHSGQSNSLERFLCRLAAIAIAALCILITLTIVFRLFGFRAIPDDMLLVQELMVGVILLPLALVTALREHLAVTFFTERLGGRYHMTLDLLANVVGIFFGAALTWAGAHSLLAAFSSMEYYEGEFYIRTWVGWAVFTSGSCAFLYRLLYQLKTNFGDLFCRKSSVPK